MTLLDAERRIDRTEAGISDLKEDFNMLQVDLLGKMNEVLRLIQQNNSDMKLCQATRPCQKRDIYSTPPAMTKSTFKGRVSILAGALATLAAAIAALIVENLK